MIVFVHDSRWAGTAGWLDGNDVQSYYTRMRLLHTQGPWKSEWSARNSRASAALVLVRSHPVSHTARFYGHRCDRQVTQNNLLARSSRQGMKHPSFSEARPLREPNWFCCKDEELLTRYTCDTNKVRHVALELVYAATWRDGLASPQSITLSLVETVQLSRMG